MGNSLDTDGRGPSEQQLLGAGVAVLVVIALATAGLLAKSTGALNSYVRVVAELMNVGDGLPAQSDVKYHGLLVGNVTDVIPAAYGKPNYVHINLKPDHAKDIPTSVTARVVPSNVFAVSSIQLVDPGSEAADGSKVRDGTHIAENAELSTVIFQTTVSKLRDILAATGRGREDHSLGILAAVGAATDNRRVKLLSAGADMSRLLDQLNGIVATEPGPRRSRRCSTPPTACRQAPPTWSTHCTRRSSRCGRSRRSAPSWPRWSAAASTPWALPARRSTTTSTS